MTVYSRTLGPWEGPRTKPSRRFAVIWRYSRKQVFASRILTAFYALTFAPALIAVIYIYTRYNVPLLEATELTTGSFIAVDERFFFHGLRLQGFFAFVIAAFIGPGLIAPDLADNGLALYLARPFSRAQYVLGKLTVLAVLLSAMTWMPLLLLLGIEAALQPTPITGEQVRIAVAVLAGSWLWIAVVSLLALAFSAWVRWKLLAAALLFAFFFITRAMGELLNLSFSTVWGDLLSPSKQIATVWEWLFFGELTDTMPVAVAAIALLLLVGFCLLLLHTKLRAYEVVR